MEAVVHHECRGRSLAIGTGGRDAGLIGECGSSWNEASNLCASGGMARWQAEHGEAPASIGGFPNRTVP
jgi:hypothetical protein